MNDYLTRTLKPTVASSHPLEPESHQHRSAGGADQPVTAPLSIRVEEYILSTSVLESGVRRPLPMRVRV
ncbi:hypothetical protein E2C01_035655 [Portunus trituberculatus]|uniref:Uncharacterized protein n=1 Tax=Portunus trituberculatus TaxID=210409 RepID=A0A5B7F6G8_PORTR|nr:hypothetical protein [Portunus trituberculatus]